MEFISNLENGEHYNKILENEITIQIYKDIYGEIDYKGELPRQFNRINFNNDISLSIQASTNHYCSPRITLEKENVSNYNEMEFALLKNGVFISVDRLVSKEFDSEFEEYYDGTVYGFVPVELIEKLYLKLKELYGVVE